MHGDTDAVSVVSGRQSLSCHRQSAAQLVAAKAVAMLETDYRTHQ